LARALEIRAPNQKGVDSQTLAQPRATYSHSASDRSRYGAPVFFDSHST